MNRLPLRWMASATLAAMLGAPTALARVDVTLDAESLNALVSGMAQERVDVQLAAGRSISIFLDDFRVTGFEPSAGADGKGALRTAVTLKIPALSYESPVAPLLAFKCRDREGRKLCALVFEDFTVRLPVTGSIDLSPLLPTMDILPDSAWLVPTARGKVRVKPTLVDTKMGMKNLRLGFDLDIGPADSGAPAAKPGK